LEAVTVGRVVQPAGANACVALVLSPVMNAISKALTGAAAAAE
jgi:hypothetical protein